MGRVEKVLSLILHPKPTCGLGVSRRGGGGGWGPSCLRSFPPLDTPFGHRTPPSAPATPPAAGAPGPLPPRAGAAGMFSPPRGAASCPPCWKPIPVTDSGPRKSRGGGCRGAPGAAEPVARDTHPRSLCPLHCGGAAAPGSRPPLPPPPAGLCNPVAAARPRAGPWGEGWGRETATRGAACAGRRVSGSPVRREEQAVGAECGPRSGEPVSKRSRGRRPQTPGGVRYAPRGWRGGGDTFWVEAVPLGRVGYPAGTGLPGHEFLCHRNLIACQVRSRLRLSGFHLGPFLLAAPF